MRIISPTTLFLGFVCKIHRAYRANRKPRSSCKRCREMWRLKQRADYMYRGPQPGRVLAVVEDR
jgi:hypothetical protein